MFDLFRVRRVARARVSVRVRVSLIPTLTLTIVALQTESQAVNSKPTSHTLVRDGFAVPAMRRGEKHHWRSLLCLPVKQHNC